MHRSFPGVWLGISLVALLVPGCGQDPFGTPSRPKRVLSSEEPEKAKAIFYIVPNNPDRDALTWGIEAQTEANLHQVIFRIMGPGSEGSPTTQPDVVRKAIDDGVSALLVAPGDSPELPKVLAEAQSKDIPVVLIGRSIPAPPGSKPFTMVDHAPFEESAKKIVATTVEDLKKTTRPVEGTALILADRKTDRTSAMRVEALKTAASAAGFPNVSTVTIDGSNLESAKVTVLSAIKASPDVAIVLADDNEGMYLAAQARADLRGTPTFFVGGYINYSTSPVTVPFMRESCYVDGRYGELARLGVLTLLKKLKGEPVEDRVVQGPRFNRGTGSVATADNPNSSFPMQEKASSQEELLKDISPPAKVKKPQ